jgi:hypothetical protein
VVRDGEEVDGRTARLRMIEEAKRRALSGHEALNPGVHQHMIEMGYRHSYSPAEFDDGDAENGPGHGGHDEFDTYESADDYVVIDARGHFAHHEKRDLELERFLDQNQTAGGDVAIPRGAR